VAIKAKEQLSAGGRKNGRRRKGYNRPRLTMFGRVAALTQGGSFQPSADGSTGMMGASDPRVKENRVRIGIHPLGFGIWLFDYKPDYRSSYGYGRQFGVMADEVEQVMPEAVSVHRDGYKLVDYGMLGISRRLH
jgi:hypothetical protein